MRPTSTSIAVIAITMTGVGLVGLFDRDLMPVWNPAPGAGMAHELLIDLAIGVSLVSGVGLLMRRTAAAAARLLLAALLFWMLVFRLPNFFREPLFAASWTVFPLALVLAAAMVIYARVATAWDGEHLRHLSGKGGVRAAQMIYGLTLIFFGAAHFIDLRDTLALVPSWLPFHLFWARFTGCTYIAAGIAVTLGFFAGLAATLSAVQIGSFLFLVWIPIVSRGSTVPFQWSETFLNAALWAGAWVIADSYRHTARLDTPLDLHAAHQTKSAA